ncbi:uncharacterized protein VTP21DRAFT_10675 [Calcarisporiella thermophila]|uniref:uncharacterized protein n=1 Tax=Calcarisporiella thermophila TaxID=911321 RepID=UPI003742B1F4
MSGKKTPQRTRPRHFSMVRDFHLADIITLLNGICGSLSIFSNMKYILTRDPHQLWLAMAFIPFGFAFDVLDGRVARWRKKSSLLGQELDSLADLVSFGVAPAVCAFAVGMRTWADTLVLTSFIACGIARLARFNATVAEAPKDQTGKIKYFEGVPIPCNMFLVGMLAYFVRRGWTEDRLPGGVIEWVPGFEFHAMVLIYGLMGTMMISKTLRIPKF